MIENTKSLLKVLQKLDSFNVSGEESKLFLKILLSLQEQNFCKLSNKVLAQRMQSSERSISKWLTSLAEKKLVNVVQNKHTHERLIYVNGISKSERKYYAEPMFEDLSEKQKQFKERFPDREIDTEIPDTVNMEKLFEEIEKSTFLKTGANLTLKSYVVKLYSKIVAGVFRDSKTNTIKSFSTRRHYTADELNSSFQSIDEIEV